MPGAPAPTKFVHIVALLGKSETTPNTPVSVSGATDAHLMHFDSRDFGALLKPEYADDGDLGVPAGELGRLKRVSPSTRSTKFTAPLLFRGSGAAYSASIKSSLHLPLQWSGFNATVDASAGVEKWTYTPTPAATVPTYATLEAYTRGEKYALSGALADLNLDLSGPKPPRWMFDFSALFSADPSDSACPSCTYPLLAVDPPKAVGLIFTLGNLSTNAVVRKLSFKLAREIIARPALNVGDGHAGFVPGGRQPMMTAVIEATAFTGAPYTSSTLIDPHSLLKSGQNLLATLQLGTAQYNRLKLNMPQAQVVDVRPAQDGPVATYELDILPYGSTPILGDDINIVTD